MTKSILWLEDEIFKYRAHISQLETKHYNVCGVASLLEAEQLISCNKYDLFILDITVPTKNKEEEKLYRISEANEGLDFGLVFYRRNKELLKMKNIPVLVITQRLDKEVQTAFEGEGLPSDRILTDFMTLPEPVINKIEDLLSSREPARSADKDA